LELRGALSPRLVVILTVLLVNAFVVALLADNLIEAKDQEERDVQTTTQNMALLLDHGVTELTGKIDLSLRGIASELERQLRSNGRLDNPQAVDAMLAERSSWMNGMAEFRVADAAGVLRNGPGVSAGAVVSYADRAFFSAHRDHPEQGMIVTDPVIGRVTKTWSIPFTLRYNAPDGRFAGVIAAGVPVAQFAGLLSGLDVGPHGAALLRSADTGLIALYPSTQAWSAQTGAKKYSPELARIIASGVPSQTFHTTEAGDNQERTNSYRRLAMPPFFIVVGKGADDYLAGWRAHVKRAVAIEVVFLALTCLVAWLLLRSLRLVQEASRRIQAFIEASPVPYALVDPARRLVYLNHAFERRFGYGLAELPSVDAWWDLVLPDPAYRAWMDGERRERVRRDNTGEPQLPPLQLALRCKDGSARTVLASSILLEGASAGSRLMVLADITAQKNAADALACLNTELEQRVASRTADLQEAMRQLESFSYTVAHDLRAPLRAINGFSAIVVMNNQDKLDAESVGYLERIRRATLHMGELVDDLLNLTRLSRDTVRRQQVDLSAAAAEILASLAERGPQRRVELRIAPGLAAHCDPTLIGVVLTNLLGNAWKFSAGADPARIEFGVRQIDGATVYTVADNGAGFDMQFAGKLFEPFQRLHRIDQFEGTGIGLATVKKIIALHGGRVWIESAVGVGTTVFFTLGAPG